MPLPKGKRVVAVSTHAGDEGAAEAKKARIEADSTHLGKERVRLASITDTLQNFVHLPQTCRTILKAHAKSLSTPSDLRHAVQTAGVEMVGETFRELQEKMQSAIADQAKHVSELEASNQEALACVQAAEAASQASVEAQKAKASELEQAAEQVQAAEKAVAEKKAAEESVRQDFSALRTAKTEMEALYEEHFQKPMANGEGPNYAGLQPSLEKLRLEASLTNALQATCEKKKEERAPFEDLVLTELQKAFEREVTALTEAVASKTTEVTTAEAAVAVEASTLQALKFVAEAAAKAVEVAKTEVTEAAKKLGTAQTAADALIPTIRDESEKHAAMNREMNNFEVGPLATFTEMRDKVISEVSGEAGPAGA